MSSTLAFTHIGYVIAGWTSAVGVFAAFAAWTIQRGRKLSKVVPPEERRWS